MPSRPRAETDLLDFIIEKADTIRKSYQRMHASWIMSLRYYYGLGDPELDEPGKPYFNIIFPNVEASLAHIMAARPTIYVRALSSEDDKLAAALDTATSAYQYNMGLWDQMQRVLRCRSQLGTAFLGLAWEMNEGDLAAPGQVAFQWVSPFEVLVDPSAKRIEEADFLIRERYLTESQVKAQFPRMTRYLPELPTVTLDPNDAVAQIIKSAGTGPDQVVRGPMQPGSTSPKQENVYRYLEAWTSGGKVVSLILGDRFLLRNGADGQPIRYPRQTPFRHGRIPYVPFYDYEDTFSFWGMPALQTIVDMQKQVNNSARLEIKVFNALSAIASKLFYSSDEQECLPNQLIGTDALAVKLDDMGRVPQMVNIQPMAQFMGMLKQFKQEMEGSAEETSGVYESQRGGRTTGVYSGRHNAQILAMGEQRFGPQLDSVNRSMKLVGEQLLSMIQQFHTMGINQRSFLAGGAARSKRIRTTDEEGNPMLPRFEGEEEEFGIDPRFQIIVQPKQEFPMSRQDSMQYVLQLMQLGAGDVERAIEAGRIPAGDEMLVEMGKRLFAGLDTKQPWPDEVQEVMYQEALADLQLSVEQKALQREKVRLSMAQERAQLQAGAAAIASQAQPGGGEEALQAAGGQGALADQQGAMAAQAQSEAMYGNVGQPPGPQ